MKDYNHHIFISKSSYNGQTNSHRTSTNALCLPELLEAFENHLRGAGFLFKGRLDFVDEDGELVRKEVDWMLPEGYIGA